MDVGVQDTSYSNVQTSQQQAHVQDSETGGNDRTASASQQSPQAEAAGEVPVGTIVGEPSKVEATEAQVQEPPPCSEPEVVVEAAEAQVQEPPPCSEPEVVVEAKVQEPPHSEPDVPVEAKVEEPPHSPDQQHHQPTVTQPDEPTHANIKEVAAIPEAKATSSTDSTLNQSDKPDQQPQQTTACTTQDSHDTSSQFGSPTLLV